MMVFKYCTEAESAKVVDLIKTQAVREITKGRGLLMRYFWECFGGVKDGHHGNIGAKLINQMKEDCVKRYYGF